MNSTKNISDGSLEIDEIVLKIASNIKVTLVITIMITFLVTLYVQFLAKPIFSSNSKITSSTPSQFSNANNLAAQFGISLQNTSSNKKWLYPELIKSRPLLKKVLHRSFIVGNNKEETSLINYFVNKEEQVGLGQDTILTFAIEELIETIQVNEDLVTNIISLKVSANEAKLAYELNNALIEELDNNQRILNKEKTSDAKIFIQNRIFDTKKELEKAEEDLKNFMDRNRRIENSPALLLEKNRLEREVTVLIGVYTSLKQELENTKIEEVKDSKYVVIIDTPSIPIFPDFPRKKRTVILTFIISFILSNIIIIYYNYLLGNKKFVSFYKKLVFSLKFN